MFDLVMCCVVVSDFFGEENVFMQVIMMGLGMILEVCKVVFMVLGEYKVCIIWEMVEESVMDCVFVLFFQEYLDVIVLVDEVVVGNFMDCKMFWLSGNCMWDDFFIKCVVLWFCEQIDKVFLKIDDDDFCEYNLY